MRAAAIVKPGEEEGQFQKGRATCGYERCRAAAHDSNDLAKGGEMLCHVEDCDCFRTLSFDLSDKEWVKKLDSLLKPPS